MSGLVHRNTVVTLDYSVTDSEGQVVDDGRNPIRYLHGGYGGIFQPIEEALEGQRHLRQLARGQVHHVPVALDRVAVHRQQRQQADGCDHQPKARGARFHSKLL